jgi:hypothetical protein
MLPARYSLHDVDDVEQFAVVVLEPISLGRVL